MRNLCLLVLFFLTTSIEAQILLPIDVANRTSTGQIQLTDLGQFGKLRKARTNIPAHYHTGIDIKRPHENYDNEPIFAISQGTVISQRTDGPYAQLIIEHRLEKLVFWSLYEHISGLTVKVGDQVEQNTVIARFMNKNELQRYGWQFDHFHLEILKIRPIALKPEAYNPQRKYGSYTLVCYTETDLNKYFYNPIEFFKQHIKQ